MRYGIPGRAPALALAMAMAMALAGCAEEGNGAAGVNSICRIVQSAGALPDGLDETSGIAISRREPGVLWTHNDSGNEPQLFAIGTDGRLVGTVEVPNARNRDWEDIADGPCDEGDCLFIGDIGDNRAARDEVDIYVVAEPDPSSGTSGPAERLRVTYPGGPRDSEALFVLPDGGLYIVSKGRNSNVALFRYPGSPRPDEVAELEHVVDLSTGEVELAAQVTGAGASRKGEWVAVRSYGAMSIYRTADLLAGRPAVSIVDLGPLNEPQGEAIAIGDDGRVELTSEASGLQASGTMTVLQCSVPGGAEGADVVPEAGGADGSPDPGASAPAGTGGRAESSGAGRSGSGQRPAGDSTRP